jgi:hypothetical protein
LLKPQGCDNPRINWAVAAIDPCWSWLMIILMIILLYPIKRWIGTCEDYHKGILFSTNQYQKERHKFLEHWSIRFIFLCWLNYAVCLLGGFKSSEDFACGFWEDPHWPIFERLLKPATRRFSGRCVSTVSAVFSPQVPKRFPFRSPWRFPKATRVLRLGLQFASWGSIGQGTVQWCGWSFFGRPGFTFWQPWKMLKFIRLCVIPNVFHMEITKLGQYPTWDSQGPFTADMFVGSEDTAFIYDFWSRGVIYYMWTYLDAICQLKQIKSETIVLLLPLIKSQTKTDQISKLSVFWDFCHNLSAFCSRFGKRSLTALIFLWRTAQHTASRRRASYKKVPQVAKLVGISMLTSRWTNIWTKRERYIYILRRC